MIIVYTEQLPPFIMVPFSVGLGPQRGCHSAPPIRYFKLIFTYIFEIYNRYKLIFFYIQTIHNYI